MFSLRLFLSRPLGRLPCTSSSNSLFTNLSCGISPIFFLHSSFLCLPLLALLQSPAFFEYLHLVLCPFWPHLLLSCGTTSLLPEPYFCMCLLCRASKSALSLCPLNGSSDMCSICCYSNKCRLVS